MTPSSPLLLVPSVGDEVEDEVEDEDGRSTISLNPSFSHALTSSCLALSSEPKRISIVFRSTDSGEAPVDEDEEGNEELVESEEDGGWERRD